jgi:guanylate kinase
VARRLVERDPSLWLSKSWTTRPRRSGEAVDAYTFVDRNTFEERRAAGGFLESAEFLGHLYGTPVLDPPPSKDVLLEIDLQGAKQVKGHHPDALVVLLLPPSVEEQAERLRCRGDDAEAAARRIAKAAEEEKIGRALTPFVVVNDDVDEAVTEVAGILDRHREPRSRLPKRAASNGDHLGGTDDRSD